LLYSEELRDESFLPPINEIRDAFDRMMSAFSAKFLINDKDDVSNELDASFNHMYNAVFQLLDYIKICQREIFVESLKDISPSTLVAVFPDYYREIKPEFDKMREAVPLYKAKRLDYEIRDNIMVYLELIRKTQSYLSRLNQALPALLEYEGKSRLDHEKSQTVDRSNSILDTGVNKQQEPGIASYGKSIDNTYDVFLCYNSNDKEAVKHIGEELIKAGISPWLDEWQLRPGRPWQRLLEDQIGSIKAAAVFVGINGEGPWQKMEIEAYLREFVKRDCPVIPIILPEATSEPVLPIFLSGMTWVDFRKNNPNPISQLIWGITGQRD